MKAGKTCLKNFTGKTLRGLESAYRMLRPFLGPKACRFSPTCSEYGFESLKRHGPLKGSVLALKRIARCHPFNPGGYDPAP